MKKESRRRKEIDFIERMKETRRHNDDQDNYLVQLYCLFSISSLRCSSFSCNNSNKKLVINKIPRKHSEKNQV
jgi:hypothetical protein